MRKRIIRSSSEKDHLVYEAGLLYAKQRGRQTHKKARKVLMKRYGYFSEGAYFTWLKSRADFFEAGRLEGEKEKAKSSRKRVKSYRSGQGKKKAEAVTVMREESRTILLTQGDKPFAELELHIRGARVLCNGGHSLLLAKEDGGYVELRLETAELSPQEVIAQLSPV